KGFEKTSKMIVGQRPKDSRVFIAGDFFFPDDREEWKNLNFDKGSTPVHFAASLGNLEALKILDDFKPNLKSKDGVGASPLNLAALGGHLDVVKFLIENNCKIDDATKVKKSIRFYDASMTPILSALSSGNFELVELLIDNGADVSNKSKYGCDAYFFAARGGNHKVIELLNTMNLPLSNDVSYYNFPLLEAVRGKFYKATETLMQLGSPTEIPPKGVPTPLRSAIEENDLKMKGILLDNGAKPLADHGLHSAVRINDTEYIQAYYDQGKDIDEIKDGASPLMHAAALGFVASAKLLINLGANVNLNPDGTALHWAISNSNHEIVNMILEANADCSQVDSFGNDPLFKITMERWPNKIEVVNKMLRLGANPHSKTKVGLSAVALAERTNDSELLKIFAEFSNENAKDLSYQAPQRSKILQALTKEYNWKKVYNDLWEELVPPSGNASSVQGELLRCIGKLTDEAFRNGNMNWGDKERFIGLVDYLRSNLLDGTFSDSENKILKTALKELTHFNKIPIDKNSSPHYAISEAVVDWCVRHKKLISA
ncbi:MAG: ankyrin repeat domain-containing protein, partial [Flavobacteriales bacterium]|nr:ankyrin repeat domain-containing protein [Flavobacteriales bacterium]